MGVCKSTLSIKYLLLESREGPIFLKMKSRKWHLKSDSLIFYFPLFERSFLEMKTIIIILAKTMPRLFSTTQKAHLMDIFSHNFKPPARAKDERYFLELVFYGEPGSSYLWERIFSSFWE